MITADQLVAHAVGDYIIQSDWMASNKTKQSLAAAVHAITYTAVFLFLSTSWLVLLVIASTHFVIDRWRLARYICWLKNWIGVPEPRPPSYGDDHPVDWASVNKPWAECSKTGYPPSKPDWMSVWLLIIADNIMHVLINGAAIRWLS